LDDQVSLLFGDDALRFCFLVVALLTEKNTFTCPSLNQILARIVGCHQSSSCIGHLALLLPVINSGVQYGPIHNAMMDAGRRLNWASESKDLSGNYHLPVLSQLCAVCPGK